jgi:hypothetical protein
MAYIGKQPVVGNFQKCDAISVVNGQAAYTLNVGGSAVTPENANHMLVSLNGVLQAPGDSFTVSGSTLTFASNLATGDVIDFVIILGDVLDLGTPSDNSISTAKLVANSVTAAKFNADVISGQTALAETPADTDELLLSDAGVLKRIDFSHIKGGGAFEKLATTTISSETANVTFDNTYITSTHRDYRVVISGFRCSADNVHMNLLISSNNASSFLSASYQYNNHGSRDDSSASQFTQQDNNGAAQIILGIRTTGNASGENYNAVIDIFDPLNTGSDSQYFTGGGHYYYIESGGQTSTGMVTFINRASASTAYNAIKFQYASGQINAGTITLYGRKI